MKKMALILAMTLSLGLMIGCSSEGIYLDGSSKNVNNNSNSEPLYGYTGYIENFDFDREDAYAIWPELEDIPISSERFLDKNDIQSENCLIRWEKGGKNVFTTWDVSQIDTAYMLVNFDLDYMADFGESDINFKDDIDDHESLDFMSKQEVVENSLSLLKQMKVDSEFVYNVYSDVEDGYYIIEGVNSIDGIPFSLCDVYGAGNTTFFRTTYTKDGLESFCCDSPSNISEVEKKELTISKEEAIKKLGNYTLTSFAYRDDYPPKKILNMNLVLYAPYDNPDPYTRVNGSKRKFSTGWEIIFSDPLIPEPDVMDHDALTIIDAITGEVHVGRYTTKLENPDAIYKPFVEE